MTYTYGNFDISHKNTSKHEILAGRIYAQAMHE